MPDIKLGTTHGDTVVSLDREERSTHMHVVGASGRGKSKLLEHMIRQDILDDEKPGVCLIDPHGMLYNDLLAWLTSNRDVRESRKIHLIDPGHEDFCVGFNPLRTGKTDPSVRVDAMVQACAQVWGSEDPSRTPLLKKCLRAVFYCLTVKEYTLLESTELVSTADNRGIRRFLTADIPDRVFGSIWEDFNYLAIHAPRQFADQFSSTNNRLLEFLSAQVIRTIIGQREHVFDFRSCMDNGDIVLVNLAPTSTLSFDNARLLGTLITNDLFVGALGRDRKSAEEHPFYLYIDECYDYLTNDVEKMLDQTRKFGLHLILSHQRLGQLKNAGEGVYNAVMSGAQTKVVFGGLEKSDADELAANIFLGELDLEESVKALEKAVPTGEFERETLLGEIISETESESTGGAATKGESVTCDAEGNSIQTNVSSTDTESYQQGFSRTHGTSKQETLRALYATMATAVTPLDKLMYKCIVKLVGQPQRHAIVKIPGKHSCRLTVESVPEGFALDEDVLEVKNELLDISDYATPRRLVEEELNDRYKDLQHQALEFQKEPEDAKDQIRPTLSKKTT